jgi:hypothetical protein
MAKPALRAYQPLAGFPPEAAWAASSAKTSELLSKTPHAAAKVLSIFFMVFSCFFSSSPGIFNSRALRQISSRRFLAAGEIIKSLQ